MRLASQLTGQAWEEWDPRQGSFDEAVIIGKGLVAGKVYSQGDCLANSRFWGLTGWSKGPQKGERSVGNLGLGCAIDCEQKDRENALGWALKALFALGLYEPRTLEGSQQDH